MKQNPLETAFSNFEVLLLKKSRVWSSAFVTSLFVVASLVAHSSFANPVEKERAKDPNESLQNTPHLSLQAKHGGELQPGKSLALEFKQDGELIQFYPQQADGSNIETKDFKISGLIKMKRGKPQKLIFAERDGYYFASLDFGDAVQLNLEVRVEHSGNQERFQLIAKNPKSSKK